MATVDKAEELLEKLRSASWDAAVQGSFLDALNYAWYGLKWWSTYDLLSSRVLFWNDSYKLVRFLYALNCINLIFKDTTDS